MSFLKRSIRLKLIFSYAAIALLITLSLTLFTRWNLTGDVRSLLRKQAATSLESKMIDYVEEIGSLAGFGEAFRKERDRQNKQNQVQNNEGKNGDVVGQPPPSPPSPPDQTILGATDINGYIILPLPPKFNIGDKLDLPSDLVTSNPVIVDSEIVGYILVSNDLGRRTPAEASYIYRANIAFGIGSLVALLIAAFAGFFMSKNITNPLTRLTEASKLMAAGDFDQKVKIETEDEVGQLAKAFNQMSTDLAESRRQRRQMTADIAHDLRSPLTVIAGYIESMRDQVLSPTTARFDTIYSEIEHLQHLITDLRTLSLADAGELPLNLQKCEPQGLIDRTIAAFKLQAEKKNIQIEATVEEHIPTINGDEERLAQVLGNLVNNALRHTPEDGAIRLKSRKDANGVLLSVEDTGEGIPEDVIPFIFDRFYRVDEARQQNSGESGLGLAIAKSLIEAHGGTINVFSKIGFGTRFDILLPSLPSTA
ncbi:MAG: signal transduction histidine kinase [Cellvibrionaceae bacterium]|jgi:signal transduction histidine kinase